MMVYLLVLVAACSYRFMASDTSGTATAAIQAVPESLCCCMQTSKLKKARVHAKWGHCYTTVRAACVECNNDTNTGSSSIRLPTCHPFSRPIPIAKIGWLTVAVAAVTT